MYIVHSCLFNILEVDTQRSNNQEAKWINLAHEKVYLLLDLQTGTAKYSLSGIPYVTILVNVRCTTKKKEDYVAPRRKTETNSLP